MSPHMLRSTALLITTAGSMLLGAACGPTRASAPMVPIEVYAPAEIAEPHVPKGDPVDPVSASGLSLDEALVYADVHAPAIRTSSARARRSDAALEEAEILFPSNPEIGVGVGGRSAGGSSGLEFEASLEQQIEIGGERGTRTRAARADVRTADAVVNEVRWRVHVDVHRLFVGLLLIQERRTLAEQFVQFSEALRKAAQSKVDAGESAPLILLVADADLAQTREALITIKREETSLRLRLAALMGWPDANLPPLVGVLPPVRRAPPTEELLGLMAERHPALRTRELAVVAGRAHIESERREALPAPTLGFAYGREAGLGPEADANVWLFSLAVPLPVWRTNQGGIAKAEAELLVADRERAETAQRLTLRLTEARAALDSSVDRVEIYTTAIVPALEKNLALLHRAYVLGEVDLLLVSQTRSSLLEATNRHLEARIMYFETAATLEGLVGTEVWSADEVER